MQRVEEAKVKNVAKNKVVGKIGKGVVVLLGVGKGDSFDQAKVLSQKLLKLRIMPDTQGKMNLSLIESRSEVLVISQFTLYADTSGGNRPSFLECEKPERAREIYNSFVENLRKGGVNVATGSFGEYMRIEAILDGPVTILYV